MASVQLRDIVSSGDRAAVMGLRRGPGQDQYLNSMEEIFAEAGEEQRAMPHPWAVHDAQTGGLVGFAMISDNIPQPMDDDLVGPYYLWKLLIDHRFQRRGYGGDARRDRGLPPDAAWRRRALHQLRRWPRLAARVLPPLRLHRHGPGHVGREPPHVRPRDARLTRIARSLPPAWTSADHPHLRAPVNAHERCTSRPDRRISLVKQQTAQTTVCDRVAAVPRAGSPIICGFAASSMRAPLSTDQPVRDGVSTAGRSAGRSG